jgi:hypothetical protein
MCPSPAAKRLLQKFTLHIEHSSEVFCPSWKPHK